MITAMIITCEILFWVVILLGLISRYMLRKEKLGLFLLALSPAIDLILLVVTGFDLYRGAVATTAHAIAAVYIGVSIAFGKSMIAWADERFQYYLLKQGQKPRKRYGYDYAKHYFKGWIRHALSYLIGAALLIGTIVWIDDPSRTEALRGVLKIWLLVVGIDLLISVSYFVSPRKAPQSKSNSF
ncbi:hypothetical protein KO561_14085 [Radiobacillus kanasensis]|uniref:hypothetical protein n=1 Tax=Radiobacillus kanasensis TaxID=2844358 RepID=UPI001E5185B4|nr:hypothetical protein [Radiobacillus kanasensis]UFT98324.1 hypothetical protein KO561_14085 [Radiobacillus kanasensis]